VIVTNAPPGVVEMLRQSDLFTQSCTLPPIFAESDNIHQAIDQLDRWLANGGMHLPPPNPALVCPVGRPRSGQAELKKRAIALAKKGVKWFQIYRGLHLHRLPKEDINAIKRACEQGV
jgi:hypothetical protein